MPKNPPHRESEGKEIPPSQLEEFIDQGIDESDNVPGVRSSSPLKDKSASCSKEVRREH